MENGYQQVDKGNSTLEMGSEAGVALQPGDLMLSNELMDADESFTGQSNLEGRMSWERPLLQKGIEQVRGKEFMVYTVIIILIIPSDI